MIEQEENQEEVELKVEDKRKFNLDGSLREGVVIEKEEPKEPESPIYEPDEKTIEDYDRRSVEKQAQAEGESKILGADAGTGGGADAAAVADDEDDLLDDDDPASFINFLSTLVTNAAASLGAMPHPVTGQRSVDLETGKYWIDVLAMLREKTKGNLNTQEQRLLEGILGDLQMQYVALSRASEEKLKAQAAQKFSSKDILGG